jgi:hypothetical protein
MKSMQRLIGCLLIAGGALLALNGQAAGLEQIAVSADRRHFIQLPSNRPFVPWGFNYDHDENGRLIEDYWDSEWSKIVEDFGEMKALGANVVRVHIQLGRFMNGPKSPSRQQLKRFRKLVALAQGTGLYLDVTGLGCYHKKDVPAWYDALGEKERWEVQGRFWEAVAQESRKSTAIFCYDLMNEPVSPVGMGTNWLAPPFAGKHFVQWIARDQKGRARVLIAQEWIGTLAKAIRQVDSRHLITVGLVPWSLNRPGLYSGFDPAIISHDLDFISVHLYPSRSDLEGDLKTLQGFDIGKPVIIEETFPLNSSIEQFGRFMEASRSLAAGWIGFYWGKTLESCQASGEIGDQLTYQWLNFFKQARYTVR